MKLREINIREYKDGWRLIVTERSSDITAGPGAILWNEGGLRDSDIIEMIRDVVYREGEFKLLRIKINNREKER